MRPLRGRQGPLHEVACPPPDVCAAMAGRVAILVGAGHLAAWLVRRPDAPRPHAITMKTNAALCLTLVGVALLLLVPAR